MINEKLIELSIEKDFHKQKKYGGVCMFNDEYNIEIWNVTKGIRFMSHFELIIPNEHLIEYKHSDAIYELRRHRYLCYPGLKTIVVKCTDDYKYKKNTISSNPKKEKKIKINKVITQEEIEINDSLDYELSKNLSFENENPIEYESCPEEKKSAIKGKSDIYYYPRDPEMSYIALRKANNKCEYNTQHYCFERRKDGTRYTEPHHLVPICYYDEFDVSLDVPANIVSLCSSCHNEIHYGKKADLLITKLYNMRKKDLNKVGINVSLDDLLRMYHQINKKG